MTIDVNKQYDGFADVAEKRIVPFHFEDGIIELFLGNSPCELREGTSEILGQNRGMMAGGYTLFHLSHPLENYGVFTDKG